MVTMQGQYQGDKHCEITHDPSRSRLETDAPRDNQGKGERFSPTDLVGAALGSCILTTMAIFGEKEGLILKGARFTVGKEMTGAPRRIAALKVKLVLPASIPADKRAWLEEIARTCPVSRSLHPDVQVPVEITYE